MTSATLASTVYDRLRRDIIAGVLPPGEKLRLSELQARYLIGLSPLREALNRLAKEEFVVQHDRRGFSVAQVGESQFAELLKTRCWLYELGLRESIASGGPDWEEQVVLALHRLLRRPKFQGDPPVADPEWEEAHRAFHEVLISACGSRWLINFSRQLFDQADRYRHLSRVGTRDDAREHREIAEAAVARRTDEALALLKQHLTRTGELVFEAARKNEEAARAPHPRPRQARAL